MSEFKVIYISSLDTFKIFFYLDNTLCKSKSSIIYNEAHIAKYIRDRI